MKIFAISDLHLSFQTDKPMDLFGGHWTGYEQKIMDDWNSRVGAGDVCIVAGDISWAMSMGEATQDFEYLKKLSGKKVVVRGNHDYWWKSISRIREEFGADIIALQNDAVRVGGVVFAGTRGWKVPERRDVAAFEANTLSQKAERGCFSAEDKKLFEREVGRMELALLDAQKKRQEGDRLVVVTHYPPFNSMRDDSPLTKMFEKFGVDAVVYGHLHGGKGGRVDLLVSKNGIQYFLTSCDLLDFKVVEINI